MMDVEDAVAEAAAVGVAIVMTGILVVCQSRISPYVHIIALIFIIQ